MVPYVSAAACVFGSETGGRIGSLHEKHLCACSHAVDRLRDVEAVLAIACLALPTIVLRGHVQELRIEILAESCGPREWQRFPRFWVHQRLVWVPSNLYIAPCRLTRIDIAAMPGGSSLQDQNAIDKKRDQEALIHGGGQAEPLSGGRSATWPEVKEIERARIREIHSEPLPIAAPRPGPARLLWDDVENA